ncbi:FixH family protein [Vogesella indigofera]|uniref:FixH family protein n=1 Tax=Vogesella indigofera TaxID=45465 RepID=A0ABT5I889_VOGIN|nr:FixH family protein [Vogesella indigofera]MDC7692203.1 FixH family protein [Vogesella indigofera]
MQKQTGAARPWYKERWFWLLMSGPLLVVIAGFVTFGIIVRGADDMVNDDYYKQGKDINLELKRDLAAQSLGINAQVMFSDDMRSVRVVDTSAKPLTGTPELLLLHPTRQQGDQRIALQRVGDKLYQGALKPDQVSHWYVRLQDKQGSWRVQSEWLPAEGAMVTLGKASTEQTP